jgi:hypothetical protein
VGRRGVLESRRRAGGNEQGREECLRDTRPPRGASSNR